MHFVGSAELPQETIRHDEDLWTFDEATQPNNSTHGYVVNAATVTKCDSDKCELSFTYDRFKDAIYFQRRICSGCIHRYAEAIRSKGVPMSTVVDIIGGTKNAVCRPSSRRGTQENLQRQVYSGPKRVYCLNYQAIVTPDGSAIHLWGSIEGR